MSVMNETRHSLFVDEKLCGHTSKLKQVDFLSVAFQNSMRWVGQADKGQVMTFPIG